jgi:hypothetical protein
MLRQGRPAAIASDTAARLAGAAVAAAAADAAARPAGAAATAAEAAVPRLELEE